MENLANILVNFMEQHYQTAVLISIAVSTIIAIIGVLPSIFVTMANIVVFGPFGGFIISTCGEAIGGVISFIIYRKGFKNISQDMLEKNKKIKQIISAQGIEAMRLIFAFRLFPYMPSGLVTYASAIGKVRISHFAIASTLGKIPALFMEVIISVGILKALDLPINLLLTIASLILIGFSLYKIFKK